MGAIASLQAAATDSSIAAVVADGMWPRFEDRARAIFSHPVKNGAALPAGWLAPLYTIAFEVSIRDRLSELDLETVMRNIHTQPALFIARHGPAFDPVQDVLALATTAASHHEVLIANESTSQVTINHKIRDFFIQTTHWKDPKTHGLEAIEKLLEKRIN